MTVGFSFFVLVSAIAEVISFVAIQLRGNAGKIWLETGSVAISETDLKLLKFLALIASSDTLNYTIVRCFFRPGIGPVNGVFTRLMGGSKGVDCSSVAAGED